MGVRVHKFLGYGLTDVAHDAHGRLCDPRISADCPLLRYEPPSPDDYLAWLTGQDGSADRMNLDRWFLTDERRELRRLDLQDCLGYDPDGMREVMVLRPLSMRDWYRFDDPMDWVHEHYVHVTPGDPAESRVDSIPHGLHPWSGLYMDVRTGERLPDTIMRWVRASNPARPAQRSLLDELACAAGFDGHDDASRHVAPLVPDEIRELARFVGLFCDDTAWRQLRPLLYTYWC